MKRLKKFGFPLALIILGIVSGHWISNAYGAAEPSRVVTSVANESPSSSWDSLGRASRAVSTLSMPFFDFRKGS